MGGHENSKMEHGQYYWHFKSTEYVNENNKINKDSGLRSPYFQHQIGELGDVVT